MKAIKCDLPFAEVIEIHPMADHHIGDNMCDFKMIMELIEHIRTTPNAYCILGGDLMDTAMNYGGYGDKAGFKPASKKSPVIYLHGLKHDMWAKL